MTDLNLDHFVDKDLKPMTLSEWAEKIEDWDYKVIGRYETDEVLVSTVWTGFSMDLVPLGPFESMVFDANGVSYGPVRYATLELAERGHQEAVELLQNDPDWHEKLWQIGSPF